MDLLRSDLISKLSVVESSATKSVTISENGSAATVKAFQIIVSALNSAADHQSNYMKVLNADLDALRNQELAIIRQEMKAISYQMLQQGSAIEALAKKKGFSF